MDVSISEFRRNLFHLVEKASQGEPLYVIHRGRRFRIAPDQPSVRSLAALTPLPLVNPHAPDLDDPSWKEEMIREWESDWADL